MNQIPESCCICEAEADWVRVQMPNKEQMTYLCHRHYQSLRERNPVLAGYYTALASLQPMQMNPPSAREGNQSSRSF